MNIKIFNFAYDIKFYKASLAGALCIFLYKNGIRADFALYSDQGDSKMYKTWGIMHKNMGVYAFFLHKTPKINVNFIIFCA